MQIFCIVNLWVVLLKIDPYAQELQYLQYLSKKLNRKNHPIKEA